MSKTTRRDLGGIPIFLAFAAVLVGCSVLTFRAMLLSHKSTAYLRVNREAVNGTAGDFMIFKDTQASLLKSEFVLKAAFRSDALSRSDITIQELSANLQVVVNEDELLRVHLTSRGRDKAGTEAILNAVLDAYKSEIVDKERMEKVEQLTKLRQRYQEIYDDIVEQTEAVAAYAVRSSGPVPDQKSHTEMSASSRAELDAHRKSLTALTQDLKLVEDEKSKLESDIDRPETLQIIQKAFVN